MLKTHFVFLFAFFVDKTKEGYLFPDTYLMPTTADLNTILDIFEKNFANLETQLPSGSAKPSFWDGFVYKKREFNISFLTFSN